MTIKGRETGRRRRALAVLLAPVLLPVAGLLPAAPAEGQEGDGTTEALGWAILDAETALGHHEHQAADSYYREALLEGWYLLGQLEAVEEKWPAADEALSMAIRAAAVPNRAARVALAVVRLRLGAEEEALRVLRLMVRERPADDAVRGKLIRALAVAGRGRAAEAELEELRARNPRAADALAAKLGAPGNDLLPEVDAGALTARSADERRELRRRLTATLARIYRNLGALQERAGLPATASFERAERLGAGLGAEDGSLALGRIDLAGAEPQSVDRQRLDPAVLRAALPESLGAVVLMIDDRRLDEAEAELRRRLAEEDTAAARDLLGAVLSHRQRYAEAETELLAAIAAKPRWQPPRQHLGRVYLLLGRLDEALEQLRQAAELGPLDRDLAFELARAERAAGRRPAANHQLRSLARRFGSPRAQLELSEIATGFRNFKLALNHAERALEAAPSSEEVLVHHARTALAARIPSTAARSADPLARIHPEVAEYQLLRGQVWMRQRNLREAVESLLAALKIDPELEEALVPLGQALNHESRYDEAAGYLRRFLEAHPGDLDAMAALAEAEERLGETEGAAERAAAVLAADPDHPGAHLVTAMLHMRAGRFAEARAAFEETLAGDPGVSKAHYQLSLACTRLGDRDCARRHLELYKQSNEENVVVLESKKQGAAVESSVERKN